MARGVKEAGRAHRRMTGRHGQNHDAGTGTAFNWSPPAGGRRSQGVGTSESAGVAARQARIVAVTGACSRVRPVTRTGNDRAAQAPPEHLAGRGHRAADGRWSQ